MVPSLPQGFSASLFDGSFASYNDIFGVASSLVDGDTQGAVDNVYINTFGYNDAGGCGEDDLLGTCTGRAASPGFVADCTTSSLPYDLSPESHNNEPFSGTAYSSHIEWNAANATIFNLTVVIKNDPTCVGKYVVRRCTFRAAQISYPIELFPMSQLGPSSPLRRLGIPLGEANCLSLNGSSTYQTDNFISYLPTHSELDSPNSTFGGLVQYLKSIYEADLEWGWNGSHWSVNAAGKLAETAVLDTGILEGNPLYDSANHSLASPDFCKNVIYNVMDLDNVVVEEAIYNQIRNLMFFSSVMQFSYSDYPPQEVQARRTVPVLRYRVLYRYWAGSLAVTSLVILMITPTFWGFWRLRGKVTLSPVDTAIALEAPLVQTDKGIGDPRSRLREIGERPLNPAERGESGSAWSVP